MGASAALKYHYFNVVLLIPLLGGGPPAQLLVLRQFAADPGGRHCQVGSLAGAAHLLKDNAGVLR